MDKLFFDHFPKTGGMSLVKFIQNNVGKSAVRHYESANAKFACNQSAEIPVVSGHFFFNPGESLPQDRFCITLLRDPIDRVLSSYYFARNNCDVTLAPNIEFAHTLPIEEYIENQDFVIRGELANAQTNHFYPVYWQSAAVPNDDQKLAGAKQALDSFQMVGVLEQISEFMDDMCFQQRWPPMLDVPRENKTVRRSSVSEISAHVRHRLEMMNGLDIELHQYALKLLRASRRRIMIGCIEARNSGKKDEELTAVQVASAAVNPVKIPLDKVNVPVDIGDHGAEIVSVIALGSLISSTQILSGENFCIRIIIKANGDINNLTIGIHIHNSEGLFVYGTNSRLLGHNIVVEADAEYFVEFAARCDLGVGRYTIGAALHPGLSHLERCFHWREAVSTFEVIGHLGYHSSGAFKLHPTFQSGCQDDHFGKLVCQDIHAGRAGFRLLNHHTPELTEFSALITALHESPTSIEPGQLLQMEVEVCNTSQCNWPSIGLRQVNLSYHWVDSKGATVVSDGMRTPLSQDLQSGSSVRMWLTVLAPLQHGKLRLQLTLVQEHVAWFDEMGCPPTELEVEIGQIVVR